MEKNIGLGHEIFTLGLAWEEENDCVLATFVGKKKHKFTQIRLQRRTK